MVRLQGTELELVKLLRGAKRNRPVTIGPAYFYHFWRHEPQRGMINVAWIKDLRVAQFAQAGYIDGYLSEAIKYLDIDRRRFAPVHAFVAPTPTFAQEVNRWYAAPGTERPYYCFANYPSRTRERTGPRRNEVVYVDYASTVFQMEFYQGLISIMDQLYTLAETTGVILANTFKDDVAGLVRHKPHIQVFSLSGGYDLRSRYGILVNVTNFKQAAECLPRKLLLYCHWGMTPLIHGTFDESIRLCHKRGVQPIVYWGPKALGQMLEVRRSWRPPDWKRCEHDRDWFCVEERIGDLVKYLESLGGQ